MRILIVEDSRRLRETVSLALRKAGFATDATGEGNDGLFLAENHHYDVAILDIMLPGLDGLTLLKRLRASGNAIPVLFLTAKDQVSDRVEGFRSGADDYLVKPFALEELIARVGALSRRGFEKSSNVLIVGDLEMDTAAKTVRRNGSQIYLKPREFALLELLMRQAGRVISRTEIEEHLYDEAFMPMSNVIDAAVYSLRRKIDPEKTSPGFIRTRRGMGYVLEAHG